MKPTIVPLSIESTAFNILLYKNHRSKDILLFLHGVGEDRTGINYFFANQTVAQFQNGFSICRFNFIGLGDELGIPNLITWKQQLEEIIRYLRTSFASIHIIARNSARIFLDEPNCFGRVYLLGHSHPDHYDLSYLDQYKTNDGWINVNQKEVYSEEEELHWQTLAVETSSIGGMYLPYRLFQQIHEQLKQPSYCDVLFSMGAKQVDETMICSREINIPSIDNLLRQKKEREIIGERLSEVIKYEKRETYRRLRN